VARLSQTKYAVPCDIETVVIQGQKNHVFESVTFAGRTLISFDMTVSQEKELDAIRAARDMPLVLFTRRGTSRDNYRFIVDKLIPLKNVLGVVLGDLPKTFTSQDFFEVLDLYMKNQKTDPDGRVAEKVKKAQAEASKAQEAQKAEAAKQLDAANREKYLNTVTVGGGYKPVFRQTSVKMADIESLEKIVVLGNVSTDQVVRDTNITQLLNLRRSDAIVAELVDKRYELPQAGRQYPIFLFLTKNGKNYVLDRYEFYYNLIKSEPPEPYPTIKQSVSDAWIMENAD